MSGYARRMLKIDLSNRRTETIDTDMDMARNYLGGSGFCAALLADLDWNIDPLSKANRLVFAVGPLTGAPAPCCSRYVVAAKSPLTGLFGEAHASGFWGPELKSAGWDAIIVEGAADTPVYLSIEDQKVELLDASDLWGKDTYETDHADLSGYCPCVSTEKSGVGYASNRVTKLVLKEVRYYTEQGLLHTDSTERVVHQQD